MHFILFSCLQIGLIKCGDCYSEKLVQTPIQVNGCTKAITQHLLRESFIHKICSLCLILRVLVMLCLILRAILSQCPYTWPCLLCQRYFCFDHLFNLFWNEISFPPKCWFKCYKGCILHCGKPRSTFIIQSCANYKILFRPQMQSALCNT